MLLALTFKAADINDTFDSLRQHRLGVDLEVQF